MRSERVGCGIRHNRYKSAQIITHVKGWNEIRESDRGLFWEHLVLDMLRASFGTVYYWADVFGNKIDFIVKGQNNEIHTFECKIKPDKFSSKALGKFSTRKAKIIVFRPM